MPPPFTVTEPVPLMVPLVRIPERLMIRLPLSVMLPLPSEPLAPPVPTCNVPAAIVVPPE